MSFLSRLARAGEEAEVDRVVRNLGFVLNTRKRCGSVIAEFGLGDYEAGTSTSQSVLLLIDEMLDAVRRYEPAVAEPEIELLGRTGPASIRLSLAGRVAGEPRRFWIDIDTTYRGVAVREAPVRPAASAPVRGLPGRTP